MCIMHIYKYDFTQYALFFSTLILKHFDTKTVWVHSSAGWYKMPLPDTITEEILFSSEQQQH